MELFIRIALIAMLVLAALLMILAWSEAGSEGGCTVVGVLSLLLCIATIVISYRIPSPTHIIVMLYFSAVSFGVSLIPAQPATGFVGGLAAAILNLICVLMVFLA